jgi:osmotically-inducible protein OsmY
MIKLQKWMIQLSICIVTLLIFSQVNAVNEDFKDKDITIIIRTQLARDDGVEAHLIDVETNDGIVTLSGSVDNLLAKDQAFRIAESLKGVRAVINNISVLPIKRTDVEISKDVKNCLATDPATSPFNINVEVNNGIVTLSGKVKFWNDKQLVTQVVKGIKGVKEIENQITFNNIDVDRSDSQIQAAIERRIRLDPFVCEGLIKVSVEDGKVNLSGTVGTVAEKSRAYNDAWVAGVTSVENKPLEVNWWACNSVRQQVKFVTKSDEELGKTVKEAFLYDPRVFSFNPEVEVNNGIVILTGVVDNLKAKKAAEQDALNTMGVWMVRNYLQVRPKESQTDNEIAQNVRNALLRDTVTERHDINVTVRNKKVYLNGTVDNYYEKQHAEDVATRVSGVVTIKNNLKVEYTVIPKSDWKIKNDVENEFFWSYFVDSNDISVSVENGVVTLIGTVDSWQELNAAINNAFEGGARKVESQLKVKGDTREVFGSYSFPYDNLQPYSPGYFPAPTVPF